MNVRHTACTIERLDDVIIKILLVYLSYYIKANLGGILNVS